MEKDRVQLFVVCLVLVTSNLCEYGESLPQMVISGLENEPVTLPCPEYDPGSAGLSVNYRWYKQDYEDGDVFNIEERVAYFQSVLGTVQTPNRTEGILEGRGWLAVEDGKLTINSLILSDEHWYTCNFQSISKVDLFVHVLPGSPYITLPSNSMKAGEVQQLTCSVDRVKPENATFEWYFQDEPTETFPGNTEPTENSDGTWKLVNTLSYRFTVGDNGRQLVCRVTPGSVGYASVSDTVNLNILYPYMTRVTISDEPRLGSDISLNCVIDRVGNPAAIQKYTWYHNTSDTPIEDDDVHISGASTESLHISNLVFSDSGSYKCVIENDAGVEDSPIPHEVKIWYAPVVLLGTPEPEVTIEGQNITIPCSAHYYPNTSFTVEWLFGEEELMNMGWNENDLSFKKSEIARTDRGHFTCRVCNVVGCTDSERLFLDVLYGPIGSPTLVPDVLLKRTEEDTVRFNCDVSTLQDKGNPPVWWTFWEKDDNETFTRNLTQSLDLEFTAISVKESGTYRCTVGNKIGRSQSSSGILTIEALVTVEQPVVEQNLRPPYDDSEFFMECTVSGSNIQTVAWHQDGRLVDEDMFEQLDLENVVGKFNYDQMNAYNSTIVWKISDREWTCSNAQDFNGIYRCTGFGIAAGADQNDESAPFNVDVEYPPLWNNPDAKLDSAELRQKNKQLTCDVCANPPVSQYIWSRTDGSDLRDGITQSEDGSVITIDEVKETDFINYRCTAINTVGGTQREGVFDIQILEKGPPRDPEEFHVLSNITSQSLSLTWVPQYHAGYPPQTFNLRYREDKANSEYTVLVNLEDSDDAMAFHTIYELSPSTRYIVQLQAVNQRPKSEGNNTSNWVETTGETAGTPRVTLDDVMVELGVMEVVWINEVLARKKRETPSLYSSNVNIQIKYRSEGDEQFTVYPENDYIPASMGRQRISGDFDPLITYYVQLSVYEEDLLQPSLNTPLFAAAPPPPASDIPVIAGGAVAGIVVIIIIIVIILFFVRRQKMQEKKGPSYELNNRSSLVQTPRYSPPLEGINNPSLDDSAASNSSDPYSEVDIRQPLNRQPQNGGPPAPPAPLSDKEIEELYAKPNKKKTLYENVDSRGKPLGAKGAPAKDGSDSRLTQAQIEALYAKVNKPGVPKAVTDKNSTEYYDRKNWEENPYEEVAARRQARENPYANADHLYDDVGSVNQQRAAMRSAEENPYAEAGEPKKQNPDEVVYADLDLHDKRPPRRTAEAPAVIHGGDNSVDYATVDFNRTAQMAQQNVQLASGYPEEPIYSNEPVSLV